MKSSKSGILQCLLTSTILLFSVTNISAQVTQPTDEQISSLDQRIEAYLETNNIPGALVALASRGEIIHLETYGMANVELSVPVTHNTVFEIGSISNPIQLDTHKLAAPESSSFSPYSVSTNRNSRHEKAMPSSDLKPNMN
jgi:hypothetical protein